LTALAHAVVFRRRDLANNNISTISNGAFNGLTALTELYAAGLWLGLSLVLGACWIWGRFPRVYLRPAFFFNGMCTSFLPFKQTRVYFCT
jgi:hypothetical protein